MRGWGNSVFAGWRVLLSAAFVTASSNAALAASPAELPGTKATAADEAASPPTKPVDREIADLTDEPKAENRPPASIEEGPQIRVTGRVLARAKADERQSFGRDFDINSARIEAEGEYGAFGAELSADFSDNAILNDAFLHYRAETVRAFAGRFKAPFLARQNESAWDLPIVGRGLVEDYLIGTQEMGGRRFGALAQLRRRDWKKFEASLGIFQGGKDELGMRLTEDVSGRIGFKPVKQLELGASGYFSEAFAGAQAALPRRAATLDARLELGQWTFSAEAAAGRLPLGDFVAQLGLVTWNIPLPVGTWMLQPTLGAEALQLKGESVSGQGHSLTAAVGINDGKHVKLQVQTERALRPGDERVGHELAVQAGVRF